MIVVRSTDEAREFVPAERDAQHFRCDRAYALYFQEAPPGFVTNAANRAFRRLGHLSHSMFSV